MTPTAGLGRVCKRTVVRLQNVCKTYESSPRRGFLVRRLVRTVGLGRGSTPPEFATRSRGTMGQRTVRAGLLLAALALLIPAAALSQDASPARAITNCDTASDGLDGQENEMVGLVNAARAQAGLPALSVSPTLNRMAAWKSEDSSASGAGFSHTDSLGRSPFQRAIDCGYASGAAENIAYGYSSAEATYSAWMQSAGHRANILNGSYLAMGVGRSGNAWTLNFGFVDDSGSPPPVQPQPTNTPTTAPTSAPTNTPPPTNTPIQGPAVAPPDPTATSTPVVITQPAAPQPQPTATPTTPAPPPPGAQEMSQGLNMTTYSGPTQPIRDALRSIGGHVEWVYTWNGVRWLRYVPGMPSYINTLAQLETGTTYIIALKHEATWSY